MGKLNNRGYLIVELILASVLAMKVAYFLLNLVVKMSSKNQDLYVETALLTDKAIMTNLVMEDVNKYTLVGVSDIDTDKGVTLEFMKKDEVTTFMKRLEITGSEGSKSFSYGNEDGSNTVTKKLNSNIVNTNIQLESKDMNSGGSNNAILTIKVIMNTMYSDTNFGLDISIPYNSNRLKLDPTIKVKDEYKDSGINIKLSDSIDGTIKGYFDYFPSNGDVSCSYNGTSVSMISDVISGKGVGTYPVKCKVSYSFNGSNRESGDAELNIVIRNDNGSNPGGNPTGAGYLYYANSVMSSQNTETSRFNVWVCNEDGSGCKNLKSVYGMYTGTSSALSYGLAPVKGSNIWYTSSNETNDSVMKIYKCDSNSCNYLTSSAGFANYHYNVSVSSDIVAGKDYMYFSSSRYATGVYTSIFDLYVCSNGDNPNCHEFATSYPLVYRGNGNPNGTGVSFQPAMASNDDYFFFTDNYSGGDSTSLSTKIYRCDKDGSNCNIIGSTRGWAYNGNGSELYPALVADNSNLYYTYYDSSTSGSIYKCEYDGTGCTEIANGTPFINSTRGTGIKIGIAINSKYLYYSTYRYVSGDVINMDIYRANRDGSGKKMVKSSGAYTLAGAGMEMQITANDNYVYYTEAMQNSQNSARINKFRMYKCDIEMSHCNPYDVQGNGGYLHGFANPNTGSVIPYKIMLTR